MTTQLDYGTPTAHSGINVRFGVEKGFFAEEGIDLEVRTVFGGPEISAAYDAGELKIGELGSPPGVTAIAHGKRFRIIASGLHRRAGMLFIVSPDIADWEGLKGKTIGALSIGSCSYWYLRELLSQHGIDPDTDVTIRGLGADHARQLELFERGEIVALLSGEPNAAIGEERGLVRYWGDVLSLGDVPELQWSIQVANEQFAQQEPNLVQTIAQTAVRSARYLADNRDEWEDYYVRAFGIGRQVAARAISRDLPFLAFDGRLDIAGLEQAIDLQFRLGAIEERLPVERFIAPGYARDDLLTAAA